MQKTNAARRLDQLGIRYRTVAYEVDPDDLSAGSVAAKIGLPPEQTFKTLVARGDRNGVCFAVIPGSAELNLKALAAVTGDRKIELVPLKEVLALTGYIRSGVTVMGAKKAYPVFADETLQLWDEVSVSGGQRGLQILIAPEDYVRATGATLAAIARVKPADAVCLRRNATEAASVAAIRVHGIAGETHHSRGAKLSSPSQSRVSASPPTSGHARRGSRSGVG